MVERAVVARAEEARAGAWVVQAERRVVAAAMGVAARVAAALGLAARVREGLDAVAAKAADGAVEVADKADEAAKAAAKAAAALAAAMAAAVVARDLAGKEEATAAAAWEATMAVTEGLRFETRSVRRACGCHGLVCGDCALC